MMLQPVGHSTGGAVPGTSGPRPTPSAPPDPSVLRALNLFVALASLASFGVGSVSVAAWGLAVSLPGAVGVTAIPIGLLDAIALTLCGASLWLLRSDSPPPATRRAGQVLAAAVAVLGLLVLPEYLTGLAFLQLGLALAWLDRTTASRVRVGPSQVLAFGANIAAIVGLLGFVVQADTAATRMPVLTALMLFVLSFAVACARTESGLGALFVSASDGGMLTRWLWPAVIIVPLVTGSLSWLAHAGGLLSEWSGMTVMIVAMIALLAGSTVWSAQRIDRSDAERRYSELQLRESEANLNKAQAVAHLGSWHLEVASNRLTWSDEVFRIFGISPGTPMTYESFLAAIPPADREAVHAAWTAAMDGATYDIEHRITAGGALKWVRERAEIEFDAERHAVRGTGTVQDITERKQAEEEIRMLNAELEERVRARTADLEAARDREATVGFRIQQMLLLTQPPADVPGLQVGALTVPSQRIDGDFYDFIRHGNDCLDVIVADVMGKGVPAALLASATKSNFLEALCQLMAMSKDGDLPEPSAIVTLAHADMVRQLIDLESFVTATYARVNLRKRVVDLVDCGHTGMMIVRGATGACEEVHGTSLPLGIREGELFDQVTVPFEPGDLFLFYSDGITEMRNSEGVLFGFDRLAECIRANRTLAPSELVKTIRSVAVEFAGTDQPADDLTCVAVQITSVPQPLARGHLEVKSDLEDLRRVRTFVRDFCGSLPPGIIGRPGGAALELAANEAASNIMKHAYRGRTDQRIEIDADAFPDRVAIRLYHLGDSFDPATAPTPAFDGSRESGFGVYLIGRSVDEVRYGRDERGKNCIVLVKKSLADCVG